jgi:hypothetical protein
MAEHDMASDSLLAGNIIRSVRILVVSEVFGAEAAAFAERHARNAAQRRIWAVLHELERLTRDAIYGRLGDTAGRFATAARVANASGTANRAAVTALPHRRQMRSLVVATKPFLPALRRQPLGRVLPLRPGARTRHRRAGQKSARRPRRTPSTGRGVTRPRPEVTSLQHAAPRPPPSHGTNTAGSNMELYQLNGRCWRAL